MPKREKGGKQVEAFIRLMDETAEEMVWAVRIIERVGGQARHLYPPGVIIAFVPLEQIRTLRENALIASIDLTEIDEARISEAPDDIAFAMAAWNKHLRRQWPARWETAHEPPLRSRGKGKPCLNRRRSLFHKPTSSVPGE